jgi:hypothetical protein
MGDQAASPAKAGGGLVGLSPARQDGPGVIGPIGGGLGWRGPGQCGRQLLDRKWPGEHRPIVVGWQIVAAVSRLEEHDQPTTVMAADPFTVNASDHSGHVDHDHIGRLSPFGQLDR